MCRLSCSCCLMPKRLNVVNGCFLLLENLCRKILLKSCNVQNLHILLGSIRLNHWCDATVKVLRKTRYLMGRHIRVTEQRSKIEKCALLDLFFIILPYIRESEMLRELDCDDFVWKWDSLGQLGRRASLSPPQMFHLLSQSSHLFSKFVLVQRSIRGVYCFLVYEPTLVNIVNSSFLI